MTRKYVGNTYTDTAGKFASGKPRTPEVVRERNDILADYLESFLFEDEATGVKLDAA